MGSEGNGPPRQESGPTQDGQNILELAYPEIEKYAEELVKRNLIDISMTMMRRLHQEIAKIRDKVMGGGGLEECRRMLSRLKYLLAYTYGRLEKGKRENFREYMETLKKTIDNIDSMLQDKDTQKLRREDIEKLYTFSEAIIAYHKYYEAGG